MVLAEHCPELSGTDPARLAELGFLRPFRLREPSQSPTREWELWLDEEMAAALRAGRQNAAP
jgi:hypothetical protein